MAAPEKYLTPREAVDLMGVTAETVRIWCRIGPKLGGIRAVKGSGPNGRYRIPESAIREWEQRNTYHPGA